MNKDELHDDLAKFLGWPPHDKQNNFLYGDYVYAQSLKEKYGKTIDELKKEDANGQRTGRDDQARVRGRDGKAHQRKRDSAAVDDGTGASEFRIDRVFLPTLQEQNALRDDARFALKLALYNFIHGSELPVAGDWQAIDVRFYPYPPDILTSHHGLPTDR